jgi:hypothetical protein
MKPNIGLSEKSLKEYYQRIVISFIRCNRAIHKDKKIPLECLRQQFYGIAQAF